MHKSHGFAISMLYPLRKAFAIKGIDVERFCRKVGFDLNRLHNPEERITEDEWIHLIYEAATYTQDEHFGLHQGALTEVADLGILGYVMMHSANVEEALTAYRRYHDILCSGYNLDWQVEGDEVCLHLLPLHVGTVSRHCMEDMASAIYHLLVRITCRPLQISALAFQHAPPLDLSPYVEVFGCLPHFSTTHNVLRMSKELLAYPILYADARLRGTFEPMAEAIKDKLLQGKVFTDKIYHYMITCLPRSFPDLQETARSFGISTRSLQAKLKEEQTSYQEVAAQVRKEIASNYLRKREHSIAEIAYLLHFSEPSSFTMAFKRWTGVTPGQYREQVLHEQTSTRSGDRLRFVQP